LVFAKHQQQSDRSQIGGVEHEVGLHPVEGVGDDGVDVIGKCHVVELGQVDVLEGEVPSFPVRPDGRRPVGDRLPPRPVGQRAGGEPGAAAELGVDADQQLENRCRRRLADRFVGADQRAESVVHVAVDEPDVGGVGRDSPLGEHLPHGRGLGGADEILGHGRHRPDGMGGLGAPRSRTRRGPVVGGGRGGHQWFSFLVALVAFGVFFDERGGLVSIS
jgi:hypothetical protein